jgi:hypothetical protein
MFHTGLNKDTRSTKNENGHRDSFDCCTSEVDSAYVPEMAERKSRDLRSFGKLDSLEGTIAK